MGALLGEPGDFAGQRSIVEAALALLTDRMASAGTITEHRL